MSWLHCVVSRKNSRSSFRTSSRLSVPSGARTRMAPRCSIPARPALGALLRLAEPGGVQRAVEQRADHHERGGGGPQHVHRQRVGLARQVAHHRLLQPLAGEERRRRRPQHGDEVDAATGILRAAPAARAHDAEQQDDAARREHGDDAQDVARAPRRERCSPAAASPRSRAPTE